MKILFIGVGSIACRYIDILQKHTYHDLYCLRSGNGLVPTPDGVIEVSLLDKGFDAAFITNPSYLHIETAIACAKRGIPMFIEKPIDVSTHRLDELMGIVKEKNLAAYVAYPLRFNANLIIAKSWNKNPLEVIVTCHTNHMNWKTSHGCPHVRFNDGVILELSHEIDLVNWMWGPVDGIIGKLDGPRAKLFIKCANLINGVLVNLDMESYTERREISIDGKQYKYSVSDYHYLMQINHFLECIDKPNRLVNPLDKAAVLFKKMLKVKNG